MAKFIAINNSESGRGTRETFTGHVGVLHHRWNRNTCDWNSPI